MGTFAKAIVARRQQRMELLLSKSFQVFLIEAVSH